MERILAAPTVTRATEDMVRIAADQNPFHTEHTLQPL